MPKESCLNPFKECSNEDIAVSIIFDGTSLPICNSCWIKISESNKEWKSTPKNKAAKVDGRGKIYLSKEIQKKSGILPGDNIAVATLDGISGVLVIWRV